MKFCWPFNGGLLFVGRIEIPKIADQRLGHPSLTRYRKVLGMTVNHRSAGPTGKQKVASPTAAWASNDEVNHRLAFVELPGLTLDPTDHAKAGDAQKDTYFRWGSERFPTVET
jgi:hypothetical protein